MVACHRLSTGKKLTPLFLESEQLFVFNLSKLSWEFKPFVVAVNSTFFKSPASGRVSGSFNTGQTLVAKVGEKILPPSCFFFHQDPRDFTPFQTREWIEAAQWRWVTRREPRRIWHQFPGSKAPSEIRPADAAKPPFVDFIIHAQIWAVPHSQFAQSGNCERCEILVVASISWNFSCCLNFQLQKRNSGQQGEGEGKL